MSGSKRATINLAAEVHKALCLRAATGDRTISDVVNDAVKISLAEDADDLAAFDARKRDKSEPFDVFLKGMMRRGLL